MAEKIYFDTNEANNFVASTDPTIATPLNVKENFMFKDAETRELKLGTMPINSPQSIKIDPQTDSNGNYSYTIPAGYHDGTGKVYTGKLSDYTSGTATAAQIVNNKVAWVNGKRIVGTLDVEEAEQKGTATANDIVEGKTAWVNHVKLTGTIPVLQRHDKTLLAGESYTFPYGLSSGSTVISAASLASQTPGTALASNVEIGKTAWVNGQKVTGTLNIDESIKEKLKQADAMQSQVLAGKKFYSSKYGMVVSGTMVDHSSESARTINIGQSYSIPEGYYNGQVITTKSLADATQASAIPANLLYNKTAWVNGQKITGTMSFNDPVTTEIDSGITYNIPQGYHTGSGKIVTKSLAAQTPGTATPETMVSGKVAWVNGLKVIGSMISHNPTSTEIHFGETIYIPQGYHSGGGNIWAKSLAEATAANATQNDILIDKTAWVNGVKLTGLMPSRTAEQLSLLAGETYTIPKGYHTGEGKVTATGLPIQTPGTATVNDIVRAKTAWVNGEKLTGTLELSGTAALDDVVAGKTFYNVDTHQKLTGTLELSGNAQEEDVLSGTSFYTDDPKRKRVGTLALNATAVADNVLTGVTFYNTNAKVPVSGTMPNIGAITIEAEAGTTYPLPKGYHDGNGFIRVPKLEDQTPGTAVPEDIAQGKTAWANGVKLTGCMTLDGTATPEKVVAGFTYYSTNPKQKIVGTMIELPAQIIELAASEEYEIPAGYHNGNGKVSAKDLASQTQGTALAANILATKTAWVNGVKLTGSMVNNGAVSQTLDAGNSFTIPTGFHNGSGIITAKDLASQTQGTAAAENILDTKTAWVNGVKLTGSMANNGAVSQTLLAGETYTVPLGYHDGTGAIAAKDLASQTQGTAVADNILDTKTAWVNGSKVTGSMTNNGAVSQTLLAGETYTVPLGFHNGSGSIAAETLAAQTPGTATGADMLSSKTAWVDGEQITGTIATGTIKVVRISAGNSVTLPAGYYPEGITIYALFTDRLDLTGTNAWVEDSTRSLYPEDAGYVDEESRSLVITAVPNIE